MKTRHTFDPARLPAAQSTDEGRANTEAVIWRMLPKPDRIRAMLIAGLDKNRADDPLETFTGTEQQTIRLRVSAHLFGMEAVCLCMAGMPDFPRGTLH